MSECQHPREFQVSLLTHGPSCFHAYWCQVCGALRSDGEDKSWQMPTLKQEYEIVDMLLWCPQCNKRHYDEGDFAAKPHSTHACQHCGMCWKPAKVPTRGVRFLPGYKNEPSSKLTIELTNPGSM